MRNTNVKGKKQERGSLSLSGKEEDSRAVSSGRERETEGDESDMSKYQSTATVGERREARARKVEYLKGLVTSEGASDPGIQRIALERFGAGFSPRNQLLIIMQRPDATKVAGFNAWKALGRRVCKGAKGIAILVPFTRTERDTDQATKPTHLFFGTGYVFDVADTEPAAP